MMEIEMPKIAVEESEDRSYAKVVVEPLEKGFGLTLGNALRRILLSALPGIAIQNIPEGAIVSLPFKENFSKIKRFTFGVLSGIIEPVAVLLTVALSDFLVPILPFMLSFAAGAMIYVVLKELVPDFSEEESFRVGVISFFCGFMLMMSLDVALG